MDKTRFGKFYEKDVVPALMQELEVKNRHAVPAFSKVVLNVGLKPGIKDAKYIEAAEKTLTLISGQKPVKTLARKSISNFKIRQGMVVGIMVTMRGRRMYDFLDKLINVTLPRIRDFRGLPTESVDERGNLSIGFREFIAFPEIQPEDTDVMHGLEVAVVTTADTREAGIALLKAAGFPFREPKKAKK
ncbi:50S ribosomal protein L5 [Parcubacteria bacterium SG8_24]|nr:MAG: 50S ribosomal protein L5 [Parcubacteria bacterium SG8_24]